MILRLRFSLCYFIVIIIHLTSGNYYFSALRSKTACNNITIKVNCQIKCGMDTGMCIGNKCFCLAVAQLKKYNIKDFRIMMPKLLRREEENVYSDFHEYDEEPEIQYERRIEDSSEDTPTYLDEVLLQDKPVLRHHIAHFCPNLNDARTCIRTCMKEGKPAFCGKDHVCYCGHRYSDHDRNPTANVSNVYAEFRDLYEKYFGPNYKQKLEV